MDGDDGAAQRGAQRLGDQLLPAAGLPLKDDRSRRSGYYPDGRAVVLHHDRAADERRQRVLQRFLADGRGPDLDHAVRRGVLGPWLATDKRYLHASPRGKRTKSPG
jgi:hypothetical protein